MEKSIIYAEAYSELAQKCAYYHCGCFVLMLGPTIASCGSVLATVERTADLFTGVPYSPLSHQFIFFDALRNVPYADRVRLVRKIIDRTPNATSLQITNQILDTLGEKANVI